MMEPTSAALAICCVWMWWTKNDLVLMRVRP